MLCLTGNLGRCGLALAQRLLESFNRNRERDFVSVSETVRDCLGDAEDAHGNAFDHLGLDAFSKQAIGEANNANSDVACVAPSPPPCTVCR